jgi:hypothetical protein
MSILTVLTLQDGCEVVPAPQLSRQALFSESPCPAFAQRLATWAACPPLTGAQFSPWGGCQPLLTLGPRKMSKF